jgi:NADH-quinone oxidoreductase subunit C
MAPDDLAGHVASRVPGAVADVSFGQACADVPVDAWHDAATLVRDDSQIACGFFDWLSAYDARPTEDGVARLAVVLHVWSHAHRHQLRLRTHVPAAASRLATLTDIWPGANWHERETFEMFGVVFDGHPNLVPLLLPDGFEGNPLRKEFVLASRVAKAWPGAKEPGESDHDTRAASPGRRRMLPPGVPGQGEWGPATESPAADPAT